MVVSIQVGLLGEFRERSYAFDAISAKTVDQSRPRHCHSSRVTQQLDLICLNAKTLFLTLSIVTLMISIAWQGSSVVVVRETALKTPQ